MRVRVLSQKIYLRSYIDKLFVGVSILCLSINPAFSDQVSVFNAGHCSDFNDQLSKPDANFTTLHYILGYISAAAVYSGHDNLSSFPNQFAVSDAVKRYCSAHPEDSIMKAAEWMFDTAGGSK